MMKREIIFVFSFLLVVGMVGFVIGEMIENSGGAYDVEIYVEEGWNIVAGTIPERNAISLNSEIKLSDIKATWYYSPIQKKYLQVHPNPDYDNLAKDNDDYVLTNAMWLYSDKSGSLRYSTLGDYLHIVKDNSNNEIEYNINRRKLYGGWNFIVFTPNMVNKRIRDIKGTCDIEKLYAWSKGRRWDSASNVDEEILDTGTDFNVGNGILFKITSDCDMDIDRGGTDSPPGLPGNEISGDYDVDCRDSDGGLDYFNKGIATYGKFDYVDSCGNPGTVNVGTPQEYTIIEGDVIEYACYGINGDSRCSTSSCKFIQYNCPNGCKDGACIE